MDHACLVTGKSSDLLVEVAHEASARGRRTIVARSGPLAALETNDTITTVSWNRRSALSARSVVLHALNTFGSLNEAIIVFSPVRESVPFHESSIVSIENRTDAEIKGYLFMIREIVAAFQKQRSGTLVLAVFDHDNEVRSPLEAISIGGFVAAAEALKRSYENEPLEIRLCRSREEEWDGYASFLVNALDSPTDRRRRVEWMRYAERGGFFSRRSP